MPLNHAELGKQTLLQEEIYKVVLAQLVGCLGRAPCHSFVKVRKHLRL